MRTILRTGGGALAIALLAAIAPTQAASAQTSPADTPEKDFTAEFHGIAQYDAASYMQSARAQSLPMGASLSSGGILRRLRTSVEGIAFRDWAYTFEIQGNTTGIGSPVSVRQAYIEYDGWAPLAIRLGAFSISTGIEGSSSAASSMLLERASPSSLQRAIGGGPTTALGLFYTGRDLFVSVALSSAPLAGTPLDIDRHNAVAARIAGVVYRDSDSVLALGTSASALLRIPKSPPGSGTVRRLQLNGDTELEVDTTRLVSSGVLDADNAWSWALESAGAWRDLFAEAGYFRFGVNRREVLSDFGRNYQGYYLGASWVMTGEQRRWSSASGAFSGPVPQQSLGEDGFGAFELAVRYSDSDFDDQPGQVGMPLPVGGSRGGDQHVIALGLNWFPTSQFRFTLQGQAVQIGRIGALGTNPNANIGQNYQTIALRSQFAF
jgi:phosphate-selective porin OprO/OprP